jgi:hypothetical protein
LGLAIDPRHRQLLFCGGQLSSLLVTKISFFQIILHNGPAFALIQQVFPACIEVVRLGETVRGALRNRFHSSVRGTRTWSSTAPAIVSNLFAIEVHLVL